MNDTNQESSERRTFWVVAAALTLIISYAYLFWKIENLEKNAAKLREAFAAEMAAQNSRLDSLAAQIGAAIRQTKRKQQEQFASELTEVEAAAPPKK